MDIEEDKRWKTTDRKKKLTNDERNLVAVLTHMQRYTYTYTHMYTTTRVTNDDAVKVLLDFTSPLATARGIREVFDRSKLRGLTTKCRRVKASTVSFSRNLS